MNMTLEVNPLKGFFNKIFNNCLNIFFNLKIKKSN